MTKKKEKKRSEEILKETKEGRGKRREEEIGDKYIEGKKNK